jgi:hypothetical protein
MYPIVSCRYASRSAGLVVLLARFSYRAATALNLAEADLIAISALGSESSDEGAF